MPDYNWVQVPDDPADAGLAGVDWATARWWQLRRQSADINYDFFHFNPALFDADDNNRHPLAKAMIAALTPDDGGEIAIPVLRRDAICDPVQVMPRMKAPWPVKVSDHGAILAVIDEAIPAAHPAFRMDDRTRFISIWQQDAQCRCEMPVGGQNLSPVPFGQLIDADELNAKIPEYGDRPEIYEALGMVRPAPDTPNRFRFHATHGSAVAAMFAGSSTPVIGDGDLIDQFPERFPMIGVNLGSSLVEDTSGSFFPIAILMGILHIVEQAETFIRSENNERPLPLVLNFSFGLSGGGRDGSDLIAAFLDLAKSYWENTWNTPFLPVLPVGNEFQDRTVAHAEVTSENDHTTTLRVGPGGRASTLLEIHAMHDALVIDDPDTPFMLDVEIIAPHSGINPVNPGSDHSWVLQESASPDFDVAKKKYAAVFFERVPVTPFGTGDNVREVITLAIQPTLTTNGTEPTLPPGDWKVRVSLNPNATEVPYDVEFRVLRNDIPNPTLPRGQTSRLIDPANHRFRYDGLPIDTLSDPDSSIRRDKTISAASSGAASVAVGAIQEGNGPVMSPYSNAGPVTHTQANTRWGVTVVAGADDHLLMPGKRSAGITGTSTTRLSGTSIAAPRVARWLAIAAAQGEPTDDAALAAASVVLDGIPRERQGHGRLNLGHEEQPVGQAPMV